MNSLRFKISQSHVKYRVGDLVRITKEKVKFSKLYEQTLSTEIYSVVKVIPRVPLPVYEQSHLHGRPIGRQFYNYELVKVTVSPQTEFQIGKIVRTRNNDSIKQHLVKWRGYDATFNSWINATDIKKL